MDVDVSKMRGHDVAGEVCGMTWDEDYLAPNPYAAYGNVVTGLEFVGRDDRVRSIRGRVFASVGSASVSIVGPPRVGKSSLAREVLDRFAVGRNPRALVFVPLWITVMGRESEQSLFRELALEVQAWLDNHGGEHAKRLRPSYDRVVEATGWDDMSMSLRNYLREVRLLGYQLVAVLDEFDAARNVFRRAAPFELLRTIAYNSDIRVALIVTSRRELAEIVVRSTPEMSTFPQIFGTSITLGCFRPSELTALIARSPHEDGAFREALFTWLSRETGGQPFLASALLAHLHDSLAGGLAAPDELDRRFADAVTACADLAVKHHEEMLELLRAEGRLNLLLEVLFGPQVTAGPLDAERLRREGIIRETDYGWAAFSENFQQYLALLERKVDDWPLWQKTETGLRDALAAALQAAYGDDWPIAVAQTHKRIVEDCDLRRTRTPSGFGELVPGDNFLEYAYPQELLSIMMMYWDRLAAIFGRDRDEWRLRIELVASVRTPMAHNRRSVITPQEMENFRKTCREILEWLPVVTVDAGGGTGRRAAV